MITWVGLLGKIVSFLAEKLASTAFDQIGDKKAVAAECLIRMYTAIAELEGITSQVLCGATASIQEGNSASFISEILINEREVAAQTSNLTDASIRLGPILEIFDRNLAETLKCICASKCNILYDATQSMVLERESEKQRIIRLRFKNPNDRIFDLDLESHYRWLQTDPDYLKWKSQDLLARFFDEDSDEEAETLPLYFWDLKTLEWPQTVLLRGTLDEIFEDSEIDFTLTEMGIITELRDKLERHLRLLSDARTKLRNLIREKLSIEDVLYVSSKLQS